MDVVAIVNPVSGSGRCRVAERLSLLRTVFQERSLSSEVIVTEAPGHAVEITDRFVAQGVERVVVWGGDGTVNEVLPAVAHKPVMLGIVPGGSGNGLARELKLPRRHSSALEIALGKRCLTIDLGELGGRLFANVAGVGFDAKIAERFSQRRTRGTWGYVSAALRELFAYPAQQHAMCIDGKDYAGGPSLIVALANSRQYGSGAYIAPRARLDDGQLDLTIVGDRGAFRRAWAATRLFNGTIDRAGGVSMRKVKELIVSGSGEVLFHVDGEPVVAALPLFGKVHPQSLTVCV